MTSIPGIPLVGENEIVSTKSSKSSQGYEKPVVKKKKEKGIRVLRIKIHEKSAMTYLDGRKKALREVYAVNRGLEELLKSLYYNTDIHIGIIPPDCIFVEKDERMYVSDKYLFIEISKLEFPVLKKQLENPPTVYAYNMGEFSILEGRVSFVADTWGIPGIKIKYG